MEKNSYLTKIILKELKDHMKRQKLTYKHLALRMRLSESGLKKVFMASDCSLGKIEKICQALGLSITDLVKNAEDKNLNNIEFSRQHENFFKNKEKAWPLYWLLVYERRSISMIKKLLNLTDKESNALLFQLDKHNLIVLKPGGQIQIPNIAGIEWVGRSEFILGLYEKWGTDLFYQGLADLRKQNTLSSQFLIRYLQMSEETFAELTKELKLLERRIVNKSISEMRLKNKKLVHLRWISVMDQKSWISRDEVIED
jgi:hypothetical protein